MEKYQIYGIGAALVDTEVVVSDEFLANNGIEKGVMTLVDEPRQAELLNAFTADRHHLIKKSGGSACNTVIAAANFGAKTFFSGKVAADDDGDITGYNERKINTPRDASDPAWSPLL